MSRLITKDLILMTLMWMFVMFITFLLYNVCSRVTHFIIYFHSIDWCNLIRILYNQESSWNFLYKKYYFLKILTLHTSINIPELNHSARSNMENLKPAKLSETMNETATRITRGKVRLCGGAVCFVAIFVRHHHGAWGLRPSPINRAATATTPVSAFVE